MILRVNNGHPGFTRRFDLHRKSILWWIPDFHFIFGNIRPPVADNDPVQFLNQTFGFNVTGTMNTARMVDLRNIYSESTVLKSGFETYVGVGR